MAKEESRDLYRIYKEVDKVTGVNPTFYRASTLKRRLHHRLFSTHSRDYQTYLFSLKENPQECFEFLHTLTINVTEFFRDPKVFQVLREKILPEILEELSRKKRTRMRIWSIGCSQGQEPYSLAMMLDELISEQKKPIHFIIHATDVNKWVLTRAKKGLFKKEDLRQVSPSYRDKYFIKINPHQYKIKKPLRGCVRFHYHDLIKGKDLGKFDLILCRNLFIFFEASLQERMYKKIHSCLKKDGILVLGTAETPGNRKLFRSLSSRKHIYKKISLSACFSSPS